MLNNLVCIQISNSGSLYDSFLVGSSSCRRCSLENHSETKTVIFLDGVFTHYLLKELHHAPFYRQQFTSHHHGTYLQIVLVPAAREIVDYKWNHRLEYLVRERCELDHTLSWLSTLGGAFSALGDYFASCATMAGKISLNQMKLALRLDDPSIVARCKLYLSLSLIQRGQFRLAKKIIYNVYVNAKGHFVLDTRLINMCKGVWCKLQYESEIYTRKI
ncbi:hypothetical protein PPYR_03601 [Photinus pyralis]|uniref:Uncharacterized protein n=2 Tax=Photinus pyralis TaxID=7054 RepID=A0A5N4A3C2_PHOPY|nr:uncharacterized protein F58A4.6 [Photinus pyralis]KAB0791801.1 hypothetical protein PPYR_03601 [Photinus pyralis]